MTLQTLFLTTVCTRIVHIKTHIVAISVRFCNIELRCYSGIYLRYVLNGLMALCKSDFTMRAMQRRRQGARNSHASISIL